MVCGGKQAKTLFQSVDQESSDFFPNGVHCRDFHDDPGDKGENMTFYGFLRNFTRNYKLFSGQKGLKFNHIGVRFLNGSLCEFRSVVRQNTLLRFPHHKSEWTILLYVIPFNGKMRSCPEAIVIFRFESTSIVKPLGMNSISTLFTNSRQMVPINFILMIHENIRHDCTVRFSGQVLTR